MFEIRTIKQVPKGFQPDYKDEGVPYLSQKTGGSYGVNGYVSKETEQCIELITNEMIVTGVDNVSKGVMYWWDEPFFGNKLTGIANNHLNKLTAQYIITVLLKMYIGYSYNDKISNEIIRKTEIELPILSPEDTEPYWDYMAYFIHNIQQQYADQLESKSEYELNLMCKLLGVTREDIVQRVEFTQPQYTNTFKVDELFEGYAGKRVKKGDWEPGNIPYVTATVTNNGIDGYIGNPIIVKENLLTVNFFGDVFYQEGKVSFKDGTYGLKLRNKSEECKDVYLGLATHIQKQTKQMGSYDDGLRLDDIKNIILELPVLVPNSKQIDWDAIRHAAVGGGGQLSGYSSRDMQQRSCDNQTVDSVNLPQPIYKEFRLKDLFTSVKRGTRLVTSDRVPGNTPLITAGETNQGVSQYIQHNTELFPANSLTIDMFGNVFYRSYEFFADDNIIVLHNPQLTKESLLYIQSTLLWLTTNYSYAKQFRLAELNVVTINLPVTKYEEPNWEYMGKYIARLIYSVYKRVNTYSSK